MYSRVGQRTRILVAIRVSRAESHVQLFRFSRQVVTQRYHVQTHHQRDEEDGIAAGLEIHQAFPGEHHNGDDEDGERGGDDGQRLRLAVKDDEGDERKQHPEVDDEPHPDQNLLPSGSPRGAESHDVLSTTAPFRRRPR